jgi:MFS family permease
VSAPLPRNVKTLGVVSLLNDASSEMIYPLLPTFLTGVLGASPALLGVIEGIAEATSSLLKLVSGRLSDRLPRRKPIVVAGYALASVARPLIGLATAPWHVLSLRLLDRAGKGIRGAPRDALVAEATPLPQRGRAFGFHRAMDHTGAVIGPLLASAFLLWRDDLRLLFACASVPAVVCVVVALWGIVESPRPTMTPSGAGRTAAVPVAFSRYLAVLALFALGNSSDAFLLLRAREAGVALVFVPLLWTAHHFVKAVASTPLGALSDRVGQRVTIVAGWVLYALTYAGFACATQALHVWLLFGLYGLYFALSEGPERALVAVLAGPEARGRAFGLYHAVTGAMLLPSSVLTGMLWQRFGASTALGTGAVLAAAAAGLLWLVPRERATPGLRTP